MQTKEKVIQILKAVWLAVATVLSIVFIIACIVGGVSNKKQKESVSACVENDIIAYNINNDINKGIKKSVINPSTQAVIYDDETYKITLSVNEINDYHFDNLNTLVESQGINNVFMSSQIIYNNETANYNTEYSYWQYSTMDLNYMWKFNYNETYSNQFIRYQYFGYLNKLNIEYNVDLIISAINYTSVKTAIELDIQANTQSINDGVFETLSSSTVGFIGTISSGITSIMAVFYAESSLTVIGKLSVIVVAVGLTYFLFRLIIGLVRMRG